MNGLRGAGKDWHLQQNEVAMEDRVLYRDIDLDARLLRVRSTLARVDGELVVTGTKTSKSRRVVPLSPTAENVLRDVRTRQRAERLMAG